MSFDKKKVCIHAANLHTGGGVQVASSFFTELALTNDQVFEFEVTILISSEVAANIGPTLEKLQEKYVVQTRNVYGLDAFKPRNRRLFANFDMVFTIFGPDYFMFTKFKRVVGFAQPWIIYPNNLAYKKLGLWARLITRFKFFAQKFFFRGADAYIVELEHVKTRLSDIGVGSQDSIYVVRNTLSRIYRDNVLVGRTPNEDVFKLGIISRNYFHKNLEMAPKVISILKDKHKLNVEFYVTFTDSEFDLCSPEFKRVVKNLGSKKVSECIPTYQELDGVFFPSLLECFSATPLEAMAMKKPLFASDLPFNRDICREFAYYFGAGDAEDAATKIAGYINTKWQRDDHELENARVHALNFSRAEDRAKSYIEILRKVIQNV